MPISAAETGLPVEFDAEVAIHDDMAAIERWRSLRAVLPRAGLFHSLEWIELLRRAYGLRFVVTELQQRGRALAALLMAHPYPSWLSDRLCAPSFL